MAEIGNNLKLPISFDVQAGHALEPSGRSLNAHNAARTPNPGQSSSRQSLMRTGSTLSEDIGLLWEGGPGTIQASPSSFIQEDPEEQKRETRAVRFWIVCMIVTGGGVDFMVDIYNEIVHNQGFGNAATVFIVTAFSFLASATPPTLTASDRTSVRECNAENPYFKWKVLIPGMADLAITSMRYAAILFISPAIVSMLKTSSQLVTLTVIQHFRGKKITWKMALCLVGCMIGLGIVTFGETTEKQESKNATLGLTLGIASGVLGAVRNVMEEIILQGDDLSTGGLMLTESWISLVTLLIFTSVQQASGGTFQSFFQEVGSVLCLPMVWVTLAIIMGCTYCKDFGKLFIVKHGNALIAKVLTMMFPIVTWILSLLTFAASNGKFGETLEIPESLMRLAGFAIIAGSSVSFVLLQKKK